jgi:hypothetical protein
MKTKSNPVNGWFCGLNLYNKEKNILDHDGNQWTMPYADCGVRIRDHHIEEENLNTYFLLIGMSRGTYM